MSEASFGPVAPYYDELMRAVPYRMWTSYYLLLLAQLDVRPRRVLDVACGTGTMTEMLQAEGKEMCGFDLSPGMIAEARRKAEARGLPIRYWVADARDFCLGERFEGALSFFDSLNNILEPEGLQSAFRHVAAHLEPGGSWVFDLNTAYAFEERLFDQQHLRAGAPLRYRWRGDYNPASRVITVDMRFWYHGEPFIEEHRQRAYEPDEVVPMLEAAGFEEIKAYHAYTLDPARAKSDRVHYVARKG